MMALQKDNANIKTPTAKLKVAVGAIPIIMYLPVAGLIGAMVTTIESIIKDFYPPFCLTSANSAS